MLNDKDQGKLDRQLFILWMEVSYPKTLIFLKLLSVVKFMIIPVCLVSSFTAYTSLEFYLGNALFFLLVHAVREVTDKMMYSKYEETKL